MLLILPFSTIIDPEHALTCLSIPYICVDSEYTTISLTHKILY